MEKLFLEECPPLALVLALLKLTDTKVFGGQLEVRYIDLFLLQPTVQANQLANVTLIWIPDKLHTRPIFRVQLIGVAL